MLAGIKGPVSISMARSLDIVNIRDIQITRSGNITSEAGRGPETYGMSIPLMDYGAYLFFGGISPLIAQKTGFTFEDAEKLKAAILDMFREDASTARPEGSMYIPAFYWITHDSALGVCNPITIKKSIKINKRDDVVIPRGWDDYIIDDSALYDITGLTIEKFTV